MASLIAYVSIILPYNAAAGNAQEGGENEANPRGFRRTRLLAVRFITRINPGFVFLEFTCERSEPLGRLTLATCYEIPGVPRQQQNLSARIDVIESMRAVLKRLGRHHLSSIGHLLTKE